METLIFTKNIGSVDFINLLISRYKRVIPRRVKREAQRPNINQSTSKKKDHVHFVFKSGQCDFI